MNQSMAIDYAKKSGLIYKTHPSQESVKTPDHASLNDVVHVAEQRLRSSHNFELKRVRCDFRSGQLILRGQVSSYYLKQLAQEVLRSIIGVYRIVNKLEVVYASTDQCEDDQTLSES